MGLWDRLTGWVRFRADMVSDLRHPTAWLMNWATGGKTLAGVSVTPDSALGLATYYACLHAISEDVGKLPLLVYQRLEPRGKKRLPSHPMYPLLHDAPNPDMTAITFREVLTHHALGWGNGYAELVRDGRGRIVAFYPIHPSRVKIRRDERKRLVYDIYGDTSISVFGQQYEAVRLQQDDVLHIKGLGPDGYYGYSIFQIAADSLGLSLAAQSFGASFFGQGASLGGVLETAGTLGDVARENLRDEWQRLYGGPMNAGKVGILQQGLKYTRIGIPPNDAQFLETRAFQVPEVCRWFRFPPHKAQHLDQAHYNNVEQQNLEYVVDTLMPWLVRFEQEYKRKLFAEEPDIFAEHLITGLLRGDQAARAAYMKELFGMAMLSPNDGRELENANPIGAEGEEYFVASNNYQPLKAVVRQAMADLQAEQPPPFLPQAPGRNGSNGHALAVKDDD